MEVGVIIVYVSRYILKLHPVHSVKGLPTTTIENVLLEVVIHNIAIREDQS